MIESKAGNLRAQYLAERYWLWEYKPINRIRLPELIGRVGEAYKSGWSHVAVGEDHGDLNRHHAMVSLVRNYASKMGLTHVCLEIENECQPLIDRYLRTGEENYWREAIQKEFKICEENETNWCLAQRYKSNYFDIIKAAREQSIAVVAMDRGENFVCRDQIMADSIPEKGKALIYVGEAHLYTRGAVPDLFRTRTGLLMQKIYVNQSFNERSFLHGREWMYYNEVKYF